MRRLISFLAAPLVAVLAACDATTATAPAPRDGAIDVRPRRSRYHQFETVVLDIMNRTGRAVEEDTCIGGTEGWQAGRWSGDYSFQRALCQINYNPNTSPGWRTLAPGQTVTDSLPAYGGYAGRWRANLVFRYTETHIPVPADLVDAREFLIDVP